MKFSEILFLVHRTENRKDFNQYKQKGNTTLFKNALRNPEKQLKLLGTDILQIYSSGQF